MWLLPFFSPLSRLAVRTFYRLTVAGQQVPRGGPVLLVANHPNSLMDPALVAAVAGRPVRFLAKAPLFTDPKVGFLVRGSGAIPVYRAHDNAGPKVATEDTFRAVHAALADGAAVGIFPEGMSHSEPSLVPLKTGAARIALGAAGLLGGAFPVVPVGLTFRQKETFRSEAMAVIGQPVAWDDLAGRGAGDGAAVRELTARIADALEGVTLNLERWEDAPLVEMAEAVFAAELPTDPSPAARVARLKETTEALAAVRRDQPAVYEELARGVGRHIRALNVLRMTPRELKADTGMGTAAKWAARQMGVLRTLLPIAAIGMVLYWVPYRATGWLEARARPLRDVRATYKALTGIALHTVWTLLLAGVAWGWGGWRAGLAALVVLPALAWVTVKVVDMWRRARGEARRFFVRTRRAEALAELRERQRARPTRRLRRRGWSRRRGFRSRSRRTTTLRLRHHPRHAAPSSPHPGAGASGSGCCSAGLPSRRKGTSPASIPPQGAGGGVPPGSTAVSVSRLTSTAAARMAACAPTSHALLAS